MNRKDFAFGKTNVTLLAIGMAIVIMGFILMSGSGSTEYAFNPDIFSTMRTAVGPGISFIGFVIMFFAILYKKRK